ncbi:IS1634 family transposase, partial [Halorhodospira halophila]|nr:IS1634 family transposase [Halorhodospira halophila]
VLHRILRRRLKAAGSGYSPENALRALRRIQRHKVHLAGQDYEGVTKPTPEQLQLFEELGVEVPQHLA